MTALVLISAIIAFSLCCVLRELQKQAARNSHRHFGV